jgi:holin-like protein
MLAFLTLILLCQLAGELFVVATGLPVPGPVVGMGLLFAGLVARGGIPDGLARVGDALLGNLSLLFVPAGVGVMLHAGLIGSDWLPISVALVASTLLTIAVTAAAMVAFTRIHERGKAREAARGRKDGGA